MKGGNHAIPNMSILPYKLKESAAADKGAPKILFSGPDKINQDPLTQKKKEKKEKSHKKPVQMFWVLVKDRGRFFPRFFSLLETTEIYFVSTKLEILHH